MNAITNTVNQQHELHWNFDCVPEIATCDHPDFVNYHVLLELNREYYGLPAWRFESDPEDQDCVLSVKPVSTLSTTVLELLEERQMNLPVVF